MASELERKVDEIGDGLARVETELGALEKRIDSHDADDRQRHSELRSDLSDMRTSLFRLLFAGLLVICLSMALLAGLVGVKLYLDESGHVSVNGAAAP